VDAAVAKGAVVYGVQHRLRQLRGRRDRPRQLGELQLNLVRSHAMGVGPPLEEAETRAMMALRANVLAKGLSGIRLETLELLVAMLNRGVHPVVPRQGSVGASGDLAPLAHLALALVGEGRVRFLGALRPAADALRAAGLQPVRLEAKEGLALINGTQLMTAVAGLTLAEAQRLARTADVAGALTLDALLGTDVAFDPRIHAARPHPGQAASAANLRLCSRAVRSASRTATAARCRTPTACAACPRCHGAARDALGFVARTLQVEMNAGTDNPMVFAESGELLSGGNFHGEPVAIAADLMAIAVAELGAISERRIERLVNPALSDLPAFLTAQRRSAVGTDARAGRCGGAGLREQVAGTSCERRLDPHFRQQGRPRLDGRDGGAEGRACGREHPAHPGDRAGRGLPGAGVPAAARDLGPLEAVHARVRETVAAYGRDRSLSAEIEALAGRVAQGAFADAAAAVCGRLD
jgi:histidine ammonia-lyase